MALSDSRQACATIEVTPAMIEAGRSELLESFRLGGDLGELATRVFISMACSSHQLLQPTGVATEGPNTLPFLGPV